MDSRDVSSVHETSGKESTNGLGECINGELAPGVAAVDAHCQCDGGIKMCAA